MKAERGAEHRCSEHDFGHVEEQRAVIEKGVTIEIRLK